MSDICPCDGATPTPPTNLPGLNHVAFRAGTFASVRRALLTPLPDEQALIAWRPGGGGDLAVMIAEWWAYLADILSFYNERIANQGYLRTADLPESVNLLVALLGYRPRPAIGATGTLAALVSPGQQAVLPKGLQFQSKPGPGAPPQIFELSADTAIAAPDAVPANAPAALLAPVANTLLLQGAVRSIAAGALLLLRRRDGTAPVLTTVVQAEIDTIAGGLQQTRLTVAFTGSPPAGLTAAPTRLDSASQTTGLWRFFPGASVSSDRQTIHLSSLVPDIKAGDMVLLSAPVPGFTPMLRQVQSVTDTAWDVTGTATAPTTPTPPNGPMPMLHTQITLTQPLDGQDWSGRAGSVVVGYAWTELAVLLDQPPPPLNGQPSVLVAEQPASFPAATDRPVLVQDSKGLGMQASATSSGGASLTLGALPDPVPPLQSPLTVLFNLLPVTRGQTVSGENLGSGDATQAGQSFTLSKSPVTYLAAGAGYASTVTITVGGLPWREVASFYGQPANATVFVTREDSAGKTHVDFGDGVNGARLPTGQNNVVATYRIGAGAASPPAGKLTVVAKSYPGLRSVLNPVPVSGGADADPPDRLRAYAPRSVLTFGRAVSVLDYQSIASSAPGVTRAQAGWGWDAARQRALVRIFVGDDAGAVTAAKQALATAGDPKRPIQVLPAQPLEALLLLALLVTPGMDATTIAAAVKSALADPQTGLFAPPRLAIGQAIFTSQIEAASLAIPGAVAVIGMLLWTGSGISPGPVHAPGEGVFFDLTPDRVFIVTEPDPNGG